MVKEVEFSNSIETHDSELDLVVKQGMPAFDGYLENDGINLMLTANVPLPNRFFGSRKVLVYYVNVDYENSTTNWMNIFSSTADSCSTDQSNLLTYTVDLKPVTEVPKTLYRTGATTDIIIEIYTYEANITTEYGSKVLSAPYTVETNELYKYDKSTDGIYRVILVDIPMWKSATTYFIGDIVEINGGFYKAISDSIQGIIPTEPDAVGYWEVATDEDIRIFGTGNTTNPPLRSISSDMMISRYAKYGIIGEYIEKVSYKEYDNDEVYRAITTLQSYRERAKYLLLQHKPIDAFQSLAALKESSLKLNDTAEVRKYNIKLTL